MKRISFAILLIMVIVISVACTNQNVSNNIGNGNITNTNTEDKILKFKKEVGSKLTEDNGIKIMEYTTVLLNEYYLYKNENEKFGEDLSWMGNDIRTFSANNEIEQAIIEDLKSCMQTLLNLKINTLKLEKMEITAKLNLGDISQEDMENMKKIIKANEAAVSKLLNQVLDKYFESNNVKKYFGL